MTDQSHPTEEEAMQIAADAGRPIPGENPRAVRHDGAWVFHWGKTPNLPRRLKAFRMTMVTDSGNVGLIVAGDRSASDAIQRIDNGGKPKRPPTTDPKPKPTPVE